MTGPSTKRFSRPRYREKGRCSWCGTYELPKGRSTWCSQACVNEYLMRAGSGRVRSLLWERDHGICAACGCDAEAEYRAWRERRKEIVRLADRLVDEWVWNTVWDHGKARFVRALNPDRPTGKERQAYRDELLARYCPGEWTPGRSSGWDADHIVPVVEGGGQCGLENYRTLCHPCHKRATAELARRRAEARKGKPDAKQKELFVTVKP